MIDFLRSNTWCTREEYMWGMSVAQVRLSSFDFSRVEYPKNKKDEPQSLKHAEKIDSAEEMLKGMSDLGIPIINKE